MNKLKFSGHETFVVRTFWPKKGYDFISSGGNFNDDDAVVKLGIGKNMVTSLSFWMKALGLYSDENKALTSLAHFLFGHEGVDPYLESIGSIWLLHYNLIKTNYSSIYNAIFNSFRVEKSLFTKKQLLSFIKRLYIENEDSTFNEKTAEKDIQVFYRLYNTPDYKSIRKDFEEEIGSLMQELELMSSMYEKTSSNGSFKKEEWFSLKPDMRISLPSHVTLFAILDQFEESQNISMRRLEIEPNSPGMTFVLSKEGLYRQLKDIENEFEEVFLTDTAGNIVLSFSQNLNKWEVLNKYYAK